MEGVIKVSDFVNHLRENDLVIAPAKQVKKDVGYLRYKLLQSQMVSYHEIYDAQFWGDVTRKRVYQLAKKYSRDGEIVKTNDGATSAEKIVVSAVIRIAKMRGTYEAE